MVRAPPPKVYRDAAKGDASFASRVVLEAVHHLQGIDLSALAVDTDRSRIILHDEWGEPLVGGHHLRAPPRLKVSVRVPVGLMVLADNLGQVVGALVPGHLALQRLLAAHESLHLDGLAGR
jgi:hypothetical protein